MSDKPILFSGPMVRALLEGRKTQTRRVSKIQDWPEAIVSRYPHQKSGVPYAVGDRLYVREAWRTGGAQDHLAPRDLPPEWAHPIEYIADGNDMRTGKFRQGMHMPRWASRLTLTVTEVRVQQLLGITPADAIAEGIAPRANSQTIDCDTPNPVDEYMALWDRLNADRGYACGTNPWVVAVSFTVERGNIDQLRAAA